MGRKAVVIISNIIMISAIFMLFYFPISLAWQWLLSRFIIVNEGLIEDWLGKFESLNAAVLVVALLMCLGWCAITGLFYKVNEWAKSDSRRKKGIHPSDRRKIWMILFIFIVAAAIFCGILTPRAEPIGKILSGFIYAFNGLAAYYLMTCVGTPSAFKFNPWGARGVRYLNFSEW